MIEELLARPSNADARYLTTTVTDDNLASWAMFNGLARTWGVPLHKTTRFERDAHFGGAHATEWQARIGPLPPRSMPIEEI